MGRVNHGAFVVSLKKPLRVSLMITVADARSALIDACGPWTRENKRDEWLRTGARRVHITYSAAWGLFYGRRKRLYADEAALIAAYVQEANEPMRSQRVWESSYE